MHDTVSELKFGVMCGGDHFPKYEADSIRKLLELDNVSLELLIVDDVDDDQRVGVSGIFDWLNNYRQQTSTQEAINKGAWWSYRFLTADPDCNQYVDLSNELEDVDRIYCDIREDGFSQYFYDEDLAQIREYDLDFVLRYGFGIIRGEILDLPTYGVWSFHHDDERKYRGSPPCFWEIYNEDATTGAILQRLTDRLDGGVVLRRGTFPTVFTSYNHNLNQVYFGGLEWPAQVAKDILNGNSGYPGDQPSQSGAPLYRDPSPLQILKYNYKRLTQIAENYLTGSETWTIGVRDASRSDLLKSETNLKEGIQWFPNTWTEGFIADPFTIEIAGTHYIFVENYSYSDSKGHISVIKYPEGFRTGQLQTAHTEPFHMSYPYVFKHEGQLYATPETHKSNAVYLYRVHEPTRWERKATLISDFPAIDPTIFRHSNKWWLFVTEKEYPNTKLYVYYANDLFGKWTTHAVNPVKTDVRSARSAGPPFEIGGNWYRPAQSSVQGYGSRIVVNRIDTLTPEKFSETPVAEVPPPNSGDFTSGIHTLSPLGDQAIIDAKKHIWTKHTLKTRAKQLKDKLLS